jgi:hypothetical protein
VPLQDALSSPIIFKKIQQNKMLQTKKSKISKLTKEVLGKRFNEFLAAFSDDGDDDSQALEDEFQSLQESEIRDKLNSTILSVELDNRFKDLFNVRKSVILLSHCSNNCVDLNNTFEDLPKSDEETLQLSTQVPVEAVNQLRTIMNGIRTKRKSRSKGCKRDDVDNIYRTDYLSFLAHCWLLSGAWQKVVQIESLKVNVKTKLALVHEMENTISQILSEFIFLGYNECRYSEGNK